MAFIDIDDVAALEPEEPGSERTLTPMSMSDLQSFVTQRVESAVDFIESEISERQNAAQRYYDGGSGIKREEGRSQVTVTKVRDSIRNTMPSIMRAFYTAPVIGEYVARNPWDEQMAKQATRVVDAYLDAIGGYKVMLEASHDAMKPRGGYVTWGWRLSERPVFSQYSNVTDEELAALLSEEGVELTELSERADMPGTYDAVIRRTVSEGNLYCHALDPSNTFIDRNATDLEDCLVFGHKQNKPRSFLHEMGIPPWETEDLSRGEDDPMNEVEARQGYSPEDRSKPQDPSSKEVLVTELWIRVDADGDGIAELRHMICGGDKYKVLIDEPVDAIDVAPFRTEIEPHTFFPISLAEFLMMDQDAATSLLRSIIDNAHAVNNPRMEVHETNANLEDAMNGEIGALIRVRQMGAVREVATSPNGMQTLAVLQYMDQLAQQKTGTSNAAIGLDPDALQSTTAKGVEATIANSTAMIELMVRNIAETGISKVLVGILKTIIRNSPRRFWVRIDDQFVEVDPRFWHAELNVSVNVGLGSGQPAEKMAALQQVAAKQEQILTQYGANNPFNVKYENLRNSWRSMLKLVGIHNLSDFFPPVQPGQIEQYEQQAAQNAPDPNAAIKEVTAMQEQSDIQQAQIRAQTELIKAAREDDQKRDKNAQDFFVETAKLGMEPSIDALRVETERPRQ